MLERSVPDPSSAAAPSPLASSASETTADDSVPGVPFPTRARLQNPVALGLLWMTAANVGFSVMTISARLASRSASWATVGATRALVGAMVALAVALQSGAPLRTRNRGLSWARSIVGTLSMLATFYALGAARLPVGDAVTMFAMSPIFIAIISPRLLGEKPSRGLWGILLLAFTGVALIAGPRLSFSGDAGLPAASALLAAVFTALAMTLLRRMRSGGDGRSADSAEAISLHFAIVGFTVHAIIAVFSFQMPAASDWGWLFLTGLAGGLAQLAMTQAYALTEAARLGAASYFGTLLSFVAGIAFLGERPVWTQIAGAVLIIGAGVGLALGAAPRARA